MSLNHNNTHPPLLWKHIIVKTTTKSTIKVFKKKNQSFSTLTFSEIEKGYSVISQKSYIIMLGLGKRFAKYKTKVLGG